MNKLATDTIPSNEVVSAMNENSSLNVKYRKGKYDKKATDFIAGSPTPLKEGLNTIYELNSKFYVVKVNAFLPAGPKAFDEAKGAITSDYQNHLEAEWMKEIEAKHTLVVNKEALYSVGK